MEEISTISGKEVKPGVSMCVSECVYVVLEGKIIG